MRLEPSWLRVVVRGADLSEECFVNFSEVKCVFCSLPAEIDTFPRKNGDLPQFVVDFLREMTHSRKNMELVDVSSNILQQRKTLEIVENFTCEAKNLGTLRKCRIFSNKNSFSFIFNAFSSFFIFLFSCLSKFVLLDAIRTLKPEKNRRRNPVVKKKRFSFVKIGFCEEWPICG